MERQVSGGRRLVERLLTRTYYAGARLYWAARRPVSVGTRAVVVDGEGHFLLVRHTYLKGWHLPGGGIKRRETPVAAVRRELREEVGVETEAPERILGVYANFFESRRDYIIVFVVRDWTRSEHHSIEIAETGVFAPGDLPENTTRGTRRRIEEYLGRSPVSDEW